MFSDPVVAKNKMEKGSQSFEFHCTMAVVFVSPSGHGFPLRTPKNLLL